MTFTVTRQIREERRKRAEQRQSEYDKLSVKEKLAKLPPEPMAKRQRDKLMKLLKETVVTKPEAKLSEEVLPEKVKPLKSKKAKK